MTEKLFADIYSARQTSLGVIHTNNTCNYSDQSRLSPPLRQCS